MFPAVGQVEETFPAAGLRILALEPVSEHFADSMAESAARLCLRAISTFEYLTDEKTAQGFAALDDDDAALLLVRVSGAWDGRGATASPAPVPQP